MADAVVRPACHADAGGNRDLAGVRLLRYFLAYALGYLERGIDVRLRQQDGELVAAVAESVVGRPDSALDDVADVLQQAVAGEMAVTIIEGFKRIEVQNSQRKDTAVA